MKSKSCLINGKIRISLFKPFKLKSGVLVTEKY